MDPYISVIQHGIALSNSCKTQTGRHCWRVLTNAAQVTTRTQTRCLQHFFISVGGENVVLILLADTFCSLYSKWDVLVMTQWLRKLLNFRFQHCSTKHSSKKCQCWLSLPHTALIGIGQVSEPTLLQAVMGLSDTITVRPMTGLDIILNNWEENCWKKRYQPALPLGAVPWRPC